MRVFRGEKTDAVPVSLRLDLWYGHAARKKSLPSALENKTLPEIEELLGFAQTARFRDFFKIRFEDAKIERIAEGEYLREVTSASGKKLTKISKSGLEATVSGIQPYVVKFPVETEEECEFLIELFRRACVTVDHSSYNGFDAATGDAGLPILIAGPCPAHRVALEYLGYENFFLFMYDMPDLLNRLISVIEELYRHRLWPELASSSATAILHGAHFSSNMTPPPVFDKYFKPYFSDFVKEMDAGNKFVGFHADAEMEALLGRVLQIGFDFADCLATEPLIKTPLSKYYEAWNKKITLWGGLPSIIFDPSFPFDKFREHVDRTVNIAKNEGALIIGASDNVMPGAEWQRLLYVAEAAD
ncbi:MAG: uroporphyrinogen decarboxylase family protein [Candidatus Omnitrophota bacterium]